MGVNRTALLTMLLLLATGIASAKGYEVRKNVGEFNVVMKIDKNPPVTGDNNISITVSDSSGRCACDADVIIEYSRPELPGMPHLDYKAETRLKRGRYIGKITLPLAGFWNIAVKIKRENKTWTTNFTVDVE